MPYEEQMNVIAAIRAPPARSTKESAKSLRKSPDYVLDYQVNLVTSLPTISIMAHESRRLTYCPLN